MNHVLLVSNQQMPNFLPILNQEIKPESVTLVVSTEMRKKSEWLKAEIKKHQVQVLDDIFIGDDASDIASIQEVLLNWMVNNEKIASKSVLNVTGGTKPMAIAAQEVFRSEGRPVYYVDIATDRIMWLNTEKDKNIKNVHLTNQPTIKQFLGLNGFSFISGDFCSSIENEKWKHFYNEIASNPTKWARPIGYLNSIAREAAEKRDNSFKESENVLSHQHWQEMKEILEADELIRSNDGGRNYVFCSKDSRNFCKGIWLEHYVFETLKGFGFDKKRAMMNLIVTDAEGNKNEFDSIVLHNNMCYVIEDKTRNMRLEGVADNAVYKIAQLSNKFGLKVKGIIVSALEVRKEDKKRARAYGVEVIDWLPNLQKEFKRIFQIA